MKLSLRMIVSGLALVAGLGVLPGVAQAAEVNRPAPPTAIDRDHDRDPRKDHDRGWERDRRDHDRDRFERDRRERERAEHERACRAEWERGGSPARLHSMGCR